MLIIENTFENQMNYRKNLNGGALNAPLEMILYFFY